jgi:hypothetical protein
MILVSTLATASCGDPQTGSSRVFICAKGVCRGGKDTAGAGTISPIPSRVFVENCPIALVGNAITSHGDSPHAAAVTATAQTRVFSST